MSQVSALAEHASKFKMAPSQQLQQEVELIKSSAPDFFNMYVADHTGTTVAFHPPVNEKGESTIGLNFSDRPYFEKMLKTGGPVVSNIFVARGGVFSPTVTLSVPILVEGSVVGYALGALDHSGIQRFLQSHGQGKQVFATVVDAEGKTIASTFPGRTTMQEVLERKSGARDYLTETSYRWTPTDKKPSVIRWQNSFLVEETELGKVLPWRLLIEAPMQHR